MSEKKKLGTDLTRYQKERSKEARASILSTLRKIEKELSDQGFYSDPEDSTKEKRLTLTEIQKRAGVSDAFLRNEKHRDLRDIVQDWLHIQKREHNTTKSRKKKDTRDKIEFYEKALSSVSSEAQAWLLEKSHLNTELEKLRSEVKLIRSKNKIVGI